MKVYTHYYSLDNGINVRWRTLLQFGKSWDVIGSVVMKNPGSAAPKDIKSISDNTILKHLSLFDNRDNVWYEFSDDDTMRKVAVLFASFYGLDNVRKLQGVIQVFNLFYLRNPNLDDAQKEFKENAGLCLPANFTSTDEMLEYDIQHLIAPVYLGFGDLAFSREFGSNAKRYFDEVIRSGISTDYLSSNFADNKFYHPQYLCGSGCNRAASVYIRGKFKKEPFSNDAIKRGVPMPAYSMSDQEKSDIVHTLKEIHKDHGFETFEFNPNDDKTIRFRLPLNLQITVTVCEGGYFGIKHTNIPKGKIDYNISDYPDKYLLENLLIVNNGFSRKPGKSPWIGIRPLNSFYDAETLTEFIHQLIDQLNTTR